METALQLLMRDGAARVAFHPFLTPEQYAELLARVERASTKDDLHREMRDAARLWGKELVFDSDIL
jgi:UDP-N-acetylglucosamine:LPS N-acetylglucosamine transferase